MKKLTIMIAIILMLNIICSAETMAEQTDFNTRNVGEVHVIGVNDEDLLFFKDGNEYKVKYEDGTIAVWGQDELISSERENRRTTYAADGWSYYKTDKYATSINWELLNSLLTVADMITVLSASYGIVVTAASLLFSLKPDTVYRIDVTYTFDYDPLYWKTDSKIYRYSNYTGLIDSFVRYVHF